MLNYFDFFHWKRFLILCCYLGRKMFWRERERESKELNGGPPVGQVRVLVVGDSGNLMLFFVFYFLFCHQYYHVFVVSNKSIDSIQFA